MGTNLDLDRRELVGFSSGDADTGIDLTESSESSP